MHKNSNSKHIHVMYCMSVFGRFVVVTFAMKNAKKILKVNYYYHHVFCYYL